MYLTFSIHKTSLLKGSNSVVLSGSCQVAGIWLAPFLPPSHKRFHRSLPFLTQSFIRQSFLKRYDSEISKQLKNNLKQTSFLFNTKVNSIENDKIFLSNGIELESDFTIIATEPTNLIVNLKKQETHWKSCETIYFETDKTLSFHLNS